MESWLQARLAERLGVCAGIEFPFPNALLHRAFSAALGELETPLDAWQPERLTFAVLAALKDRLEDRDSDRAFDEVRRYLEDDLALETPRALRFARRVGDLFDRYHAYRPDLCERWRVERPRGEGWSPILWNDVRERLGEDPSERATRFLKRCEDSKPVSFEGFPARVSLFGVSMLPPFHVRLLAALARHVEVDLYVPTPSREYLGDVRTKRESRRDARRAAERGIDPSRLALDQDHPVLAAFGRLGRDFQAALEEVHYDEADDDAFEEPAGTTTLELLHADLLSLRPPERGPVDDSIALHSCHSPMRQVEVLHDRLLRLFADDRGLEPRDVLCMTPDLDTFAPLVEAVFGTEREGQPRIPFRIADRAVRRESEVADAFLRLADLAGGRLSATEVFDVLSLPVVSGRFGLDADGLDLAAGWIRDAGVRWGRDAAHRAAEGQPATERNTWRFGLDRLLLGVAMRGDGTRTFAGVLPVDDVEGTDTASLGGLAAFVAALFERTTDLERGPRALPAWTESLLRLLDLIRQDDENAWEHEAVRDALLTAADEAAAAGFDGRLDLAAARDLVTARLDRAAGSAVFSTGGVTFCEMVPMRSVPHAVVCLLGLDDGAFPRARTAASFDLIAASPRAGDRDPRDEDRQLFLEALLAARRRLLVFYTGRHVRTNAKLPPSVVVSELVDALGGPAPVEHPLQAFAPAAFRPSEPERQSFRADLLEGALAIVSGADDADPFLSEALPERAELPEGERTVNLDDLRRTLENPARTLLRERLRIGFPAEEGAFEDREPFELDALERWQLRHVVHAGIRKEDRAEVLSSAIEATGRLPLGTRGAIELAVATTKMRAFEAAVAGDAEGPVEWMSVEVPLRDVVLVGRVPRLAGRDVVFFVKDSSDKPKDRLAAWILHLAANARARFETRAWSFDKKDGGPAAKRLVLAPVDDAIARLEELWELHRRALREAVPFHPDVSWAFVTEGRDAARATWRKQRKDGPPAVRDEEHVRRVFGEESMLDHRDFERLARAIVEPVLAALAAGEEAT